MDGQVCQGRIAVATVRRSRPLRQLNEDCEERRSVMRNELHPTAHEWGIMHAGGWLVGFDRAANRLTEGIALILIAAVAIGFLVSSALALVELN